MIWLLVLTYALTTGEVGEAVYSGGVNKPVEFRSKEACEKVLKEQDKDVSKIDTIRRYKLECIAIKKDKDA